MIRLLPFALEAILLVFCLIDCVLADDARVRNLPKWGWILLIVVVPLVGGVAWLLAGRPARTADRPASATPQWESPPTVRPRAPDDDPEFLAKLTRDNADQERFLKRWEDDLRRREEELRQQDGAGDPTDPNPDDQR
ncbi:PLD nuclease N-terminal domain-containing protein [Propionicimonas sp.]|uniref:PLD nuclease N-terminal domain-containing protein n=1 Tax=Propionicimonas sp. TaxID=1955623 RepID=UPI0039E4F555